MNSNSAVRVLLVGTLLLAAAGCDHSQSDSGGGPPPATIVVVSAPVEQQVADFVDYTGRTDSAESVEIRSRVTGFLRSVLFKDGAEVALNAPLYQIDDREFRASLEAAKADLTSGLARQERANGDFRRIEALRKQGVATAEMFDQAQSNKREADAFIQSAEAKRDRAQLDVDFSKIAAPISGKISRNQTSVGNLINANATVLTTLVSVDPIYVYFDVDEPTLLKIQQQVRRGDIEGAKTAEIPVLMGLAIDQGYPHQGKLDFVENRINPATGTLRVRGAFANPRPARGERVLEAGLFARVRVPIGKPKERALLVSDRAIGTDQGQKYLYVVNDKNEVVFRPVQLGATHDGLRAIVEGLKAGERVIIDGLQRVRPGSVVDPKPGNMRGRAGEIVAAKPAGPVGEKRLFALAIKQSDPFASANGQVLHR